RTYPFRSFRCRLAQRDPIVSLTEENSTSGRGPWVLRTTSPTLPKPASRPSECHCEVVSGKSAARTWAVMVAHSAGVNALHDDIWRSQRSSQVSRLFGEHGF